MIQIPAREFYFVRHGKTDANAQGLMCGGEWDIALNAEGVDQAMSLAAFVTKLSPPVESLFVSPMLRTRQTAEYLNKQLKAPVTIVEGLREWCVGEWEAKPWGEVPNPFNTTIEPPGGESRADFESRIAAAVAGVLTNFSGIPLLVSHGAAAHALFTVLGTDPLQIKNCVIYLISPTDIHWTLKEIGAPPSQ